jgi:uncharacterized protein
VQDNAEAGRFELAEGGRIAYADYERTPGLLVIRFVYAPPSLRGTGAAGRLMQAVAEQARAEERRIRALCGYARGWLQEQPTYRDLLD